jgi:hypothetical protein
VRDEPRGPEDHNLPGDPTDWYRGTWTAWNTTSWRSMAPESHSLMSPFIIIPCCR